MRRVAAESVATLLLTRPVEEGDEAAAVVADMDQLGEMARWRRKGERYGKRCRDLFEVAAGEVLKCSLSRKERGHLL